MNGKKQPLSGEKDKADEELDELLQKIYDERGFDFRDYKRMSLKRRIQKRMDANKIGTYREYMKFLDQHQDEYPELFDTMLINVTEFFRDPDAWKVIENEVLPDIISRKKKGDSIRIWSSGCASGEESYSIAILLAEALGDVIKDFDVRIYATEIDDAALADARKGVYQPEKLKNVSPELLEKYFTKEDSVYKISRSIRQMVAFGRQDLTIDAPISHLDLLICRNVLIYFNSELQSRLLYRFNFALERGGYIFFGKSESTLLGSKLFSVVNHKWRVYKKTISITDLAPGERRRAIIEEAVINQAVLESKKELRIMDFYHQAIIQNMSPALIVINRNNIVTTWNLASDGQWMIKADYAIGRNFYEIGMQERITGIIEAIRQSTQERKTVQLKDKEIVNYKGEKKYLDVTVVPLIDQNKELHGTIIMTDDVTEDKKLRDDLLRANEELNELNEKRMTANEELESTNEELETTTEELQSTAEELETSNEELQSTNEELETSNEELRSVNEELETSNEELRERTLQLNTINTYNMSIINNIVESIVVLDSNGMITTWNPGAANMWGVGQGDAIGKNFFILHPPRGISVEDLRRMIKQVYDSRAPLRDNEIKYVTQSGEEHTLLLSILPLVSGNDYLGTMLLSRDITGSTIKMAR